VGHTTIVLTACNFPLLQGAPQIVTSSWGGARKQPFAFTEHGVTMLAGILKSEKAIQMNITIVRAFIALRQIAVQYKELAKSYLFWRIPTTSNSKKSTRL
jgi:hypothetical protein